VDDGKSVKQQWAQLRQMEDLISFAKCFAETLTGEAWLAIGAGPWRDRVDSQPIFTAFCAQYVLGKSYQDS